MNYLCKCILSLIFLLQLQSCISISPTLPLPPEMKLSQIREDQVLFKLTEGADLRCLTIPQQELLRNAIANYFVLNENSKVIVSINETYPMNPVLGSLNIVGTYVTATILPLYFESRFKIEIQIYDNKVVRNYETSIDEKGILSILILPLVPWRELDAKRRHNINSAIFEVSKRQPIHTTFHNEPSIVTSKMCETKRDFIELRQHW